MTTTIREQIITATITKVAKIRKENGYNTDCGTDVLRAIKLIDPERLPLSAVWPQPEEATSEYGKTLCIMPIRVECMLSFGINNPSVMAEKMLGDLVENIFGTEWVLPFTTGTIEIKVGDSITGADSSTTGYVCGIEITSGTWGGGDAAGNLSLRRIAGDFQAENIKISGVIVAATTGATTAESAVKTTTDDLAESIEYAGGGTDEYPDDGNVSIGASILINIKYVTKSGDPYTQ